MKWIAFFLEHSTFHSNKIKFTYYSGAIYAIHRSEYAVIPAYKISIKSIRRAYWTNRQFFVSFNFDQGMDFGVRKCKWRLEKYGFHVNFADIIFDLWVFFVNKIICNSKSTTKVTKWNEKW